MHSFRSFRSTTHLGMTQWWKGVNGRRPRDADINYAEKMSFSSPPPPPSFPRDPSDVMQLWMDPDATEMMLQDRCSIISGMTNSSIFTVLF